MYIVVNNSSKNELSSHDLIKKSINYYDDTRSISQNRTRAVRYRKALMGKW